MKSTACENAVCEMSCSRPATCSCRGAPSVRKQDEDAQAVLVARDVLERKRERRRAGLIYSF